MLTGFRSVFFYVDIFAAVFLAWELGFIEAGESQASSTGVYARIGRVAARSGRLVLVEQLITRVMRQTNHTEAQQSEKRAKIQDSRSKISKKLESSIAENMSYRVLFGSFLVMIGGMAVYYLYVGVNDTGVSSNPPQVSSQAVHLRVM